MSSVRDRLTGLRRTGIRSFHEIERNLVGVNGPDALPHNETGVIGWGTSWRMQGYLLMAERTGRPAYSERLAELIDQVLLARDDVRGVSDFRGRGLPVWSGRRPALRRHRDGSGPAGRRGERAQPRPAGRRPGGPGPVRRVRAAHRVDTYCAALLAS
jgi:hypothetical protein